MEFIEELGDRRLFMKFYGATNKGKVPLLNWTSRHEDITGGMEV
jgi:hypothetical protein